MKQCLFWLVEGKRGSYGAVLICCTTAPSICVRAVGSWQRQAMYAWMVSPARRVRAVRVCSKQAVRCGAP
jgi:hypothetical protein